MSENVPENQNAPAENITNEPVVEVSNENAANLEVQDTNQNIIETDSAPDQKEETPKDVKENENDSKDKKESIPNIHQATTSVHNSTHDVTPDAFCEKLSNQSSNISIMCRICYDDTLDEPIISPCKCKGTVGMMHKSCLEKWLAESNTNRCDLCFHRFETERTTKFSVGQSLYRWLRYPPSSFAFPIRDMRSDMITSIILIPFSFLLVYLCLFAAEYYNRQGFTVIPVARWTGISVMFMGIVIILGFCTWVYLVFRYHSRVWYFWWQRETIVRIMLKNNPEFITHNHERCS